MDGCIFCKIIEYKIPAKIVANTDDILVIHDIAPKAPIHYLIIPKKHIKDVSSLENTDSTLITHSVLMAKQLAQEFTNSQSFRLITNNGIESGQSVFHLHFHFLSGARLDW